MKIGIENLISTDNASITSTIVAEPGRDEENVLTSDSLFIWQVENGSATLLLELDDYVIIDFIALINCVIETSVTVNVYETYPGAVSATKTILVGDLTGLFFKNTFFDLEETLSIEAIELVFAGPSADFLTSLGTIWVGSMIDFGCSEDLKFQDRSTDSVSISRANMPDTKRMYDYQEIEFITRKEIEYQTLRGYLRTLFAIGFGTPRPILIDDGPFVSAPEIVYGIFDSEKRSPDMIEADTETLSQITIGIREVS